MEPLAGGSGIPEIKAFLNGVNLHKVVQVRVLVAKVLGMCFSCAAGLPLGKEGPMIHAGAIIGGVISQGNRLCNFGFDNSWTKFQDLRNDQTKRDFVTYGAAAGVGAAFKAPIGGILFTLEEGASFWSTSLTFRAFFCAMITQLVVSLMNSKQSFGRDDSEEMFAFGQFDNLDNGSTNYRIYELFIFVAMGAAGGVLGSLFNHINEKVSIFRMKHINQYKWKRMVELLFITGLMAFFAFVLSACWVECTPLPTMTSDWTVQEVDLLGKLVQFQCSEGYYNQLASLYFTSSEVAMRQMFHYREYDGTTYNTFDTGALVLFFIPYYLLASVVSGVMAPAGLFVPTLVSGAAFGRIIGHLLNCAFPGYVADSGTYALIGAAAMLGGMARMTIAGTIIVLEACGNMAYLLPLMLVFGAARYTGNAINEGMYEMQIHLKEIPFLEGSLHSLGLLNYHPIQELMESDVVTLREVDRVGRVYHILKTTKHNGFPVVNENGILRGFILRKTLATLLKLKAFSSPSSATTTTEGGLIQLAPTATVFYDTVERNYPDYPTVDDARITKGETLLWIDLRSYYDASPYTIGQRASVQRAYRLFRTMGLRHLVVTDSDNKVVGVVTRQDITEHRLHEKWHHEGSEMQKQINVEALTPAFVNPDEGLTDEKGSLHKYFDENMYDEDAMYSSDGSFLGTADTINGNSDHRDMEGIRGAASSGAEGNNSNIDVDSHLGFPRQTGAFNSGGNGSGQQQQQAVGSRMKQPKSFKADR